MPPFQGNAAKQISTTSPSLYATSKKSFLKESYSHKFRLRRIRQTHGWSLSLWCDPPGPVRTFWKQRLFRTKPLARFWEGATQREVCVCVCCVLCVVCCVLGVVVVCVCVLCVVCCVLCVVCCVLCVVCCVLCVVCCVV